MAKLANQIIVAINLAALSEGLVFASKSGVDPLVLIRAIRGGLAGSAVMESKAPRIVNRDFKPGFRTMLQQKDLKNALLTATERDIPLPFTSLVQQIIGALVNDSKGELDHSAIELFLENMAKIEVGRQEASVERVPKSCGLVRRNQNLARVQVFIQQKLPVFFEQFPVSPN